MADRPSDLGNGASPADTEQEAAVGGREGRNGSEGPAGRRFDIGELADLVGLGTSVLRFYEREGLLDPAGRVGGRRYYDEAGLRQLAAILYWEDAGLTLHEIAGVLREAGGSIEAVRGLARNRIADLEQLVEHATAVKEFLAHVLDCTHPRVDDCPEYQERIRERADTIADDDYRRQRHLRLQRTSLGHLDTP
jgi:MerR family transcriptional regulator, copper efflux regulator